MTRKNFRIYSFHITEKCNCITIRWPSFLKCTRNVKLYYNTSCLLYFQTELWFHDENNNNNNIIIIIINDSQSATSLRDQQPGLDSDSSGADNLTVSGHISQLEFDSATNRRIPSPEAIQVNWTKAYGLKKTEKKEAMVNEIGTQRNIEKNGTRPTWSYTKS